MNLAYDMQGEKDFSRQLRTESQAEAIGKQDWAIAQAFGDTICIDKGFLAAASLAYNEPTDANRLAFAVKTERQLAAYFQMLADDGVTA